MKKGLLKLALQVLGISWKKFNRWGKKKKRGIKTQIKIKEESKPAEVKKYCNVEILESDKKFSESIINVKGYNWYCKGTLGQGIKYCTLDDGLVYHKNLAHLEHKIIRKTFTGQLETNDQKGHGTHIAGLILNDIGITTGLCPKVDIYYHFKILNAGFGMVDNLVSALQYILNMADSERPHYIGMSLGMRLEKPYPDDVKQANDLLRQLSNKGVIISANSGNNGIARYFDDPYKETRQWWPSTESNVIAVGAVDDNLKIADFSSPGDLDFVADGVNELSLSNDEIGYSTMRGTSQARPKHDSFVVAFLSWMLLKGMSLENVLKNYKELLKEYDLIRDLGIEGKDEDYGLGILRFK